jgi:hypothetical protein
MTANVLVLNATYESLSHTRLGRAVALVLRGDAVIEEALPGRQLNHAGGFMLFPKVIRMLRYVKVFVQHGPDLYSKRGILRRDNYSCGYCGKTATTVDHIIPISKGGERRSWLNGVASCQPCNNRKRDRTPAQAGMSLQVTPFVPLRATSFVKAG